MKEKRFETGKSPHLFINCRGDLKVRGWAELAVTAGGDEFTVTEDDSGLQIESQGDLTLMVPGLASATVGMIAGDLLLKNVGGEIQINEANGDVILENLNNVAVKVVSGDLAGRNLKGPLSALEVRGDIALRNGAGLIISTLYGDLAARNMNGSLEIGTVMGDAALSGVSDSLSIAECYRDVNLRNLGGVIQVTKARGDIRLHGPLSPGKHSLAAGGDIVVRWPADTPLVIEATAPEVRCNLLLQDVVEDKGRLSGRLGKGQTSLILEAAGRIIFKDSQSPKDGFNGYEAVDFDYMADLGDLGGRIAAEINDRLSAWTARWEQEFGPEFAAQIERKAEQAAQKAERTAERAIRQAEKAAKKANWKMKRSVWTPPEPPKAAAKEKRATVEEQLKILHMVENGVISPEEADSLLQAIEN